MMDRKKAINIAIESIMIRDMTPNIKIEIITALKGMEMEEDIRELSKKIINRAYGISYIDTDSFSKRRKEMMNETPKFEDMNLFPTPELIVKTTEGELHIMDAKRTRIENGIIPVFVVYNSNEELVFMCHAADFKLAYRPN